MVRRPGFIPIHLLGIIALLATRLCAAEPAVSTVPNRVPLTRPEMKEALEALKRRSPRIPVPAITDDERAQLGDRADSFEARLRLRYLAHERQGGWSRDNDPHMSLSFAFKTMLFWIVARVNNCHY